MTDAEIMIDGLRVQFRERLAAFNVDTFEAGEQGTVVFAHPDAADDEPIVVILLDTHHPALKEWGNEVHVGRTKSGFEIVPGAFEPARPKIDFTPRYNERGELS